jgi:DNA repair protein RecO (recombination protein O)
MAVDERTTGIILRTRPLTETSLIVHWLTPDCGRIATVAKGARRAKSPFRGKLDLYFLAEFSFQRSRRSELHTLREVSLRETHSALRTDLGYLHQAAYCAALIEQTTETETPLVEIFNLFKGFVETLPKQSPQALTIFAFEIKLLNVLGLQPDLTETKLSEGSKSLLERLAEFDWASLMRIKLSAPQAAEIRQFLHGFLIYHLEKIPQARTAALEAR